MATVLAKVSDALQKGDRQYTSAKRCQPGSSEKSDSEKTAKVCCMYRFRARFSFVESYGFAECASFLTCNDSPGSLSPFASVHTTTPNWAYQA